MISEGLRPFGRRAAFYLAAAVSDFYIPWSSMVEHKIQSADMGNGLSLHLQKVTSYLPLSCGDQNCHGAIFHRGCQRGFAEAQSSAVGL